MTNNITITGCHLRSIVVYIHECFMDLIYSIGVNSIVLDHYNSMPEYSLKDGNRGR